METLVLMTNSVVGLNYCFRKTLASLNGLVSVCKQISYYHQTQTTSLSSLLAELNLDFKFKFLHQLFLDFQAASNFMPHSHVVPVSASSSSSEGVATSVPTPHIKTQGISRHADPDCSVSILKDLSTNSKGLDTKELEESSQASLEASLEATTSAGGVGVTCKALPAPPRVCDIRSGRGHAYPSSAVETTIVTRDTQVGIGISASQERALAVQAHTKSKNRMNLSSSPVDSCSVSFCSLSLELSKDKAIDQRNLSLGCSQEAEIRKDQKSLSKSGATVLSEMYWKSCPHETMRFVLGTAQNKLEEMHMELERLKRLQQSQNWLMQKFWPIDWQQQCTLIRAHTRQLNEIMKIILELGSMKVFSL